MDVTLHSWKHIAQVMLRHLQSMTYLPNVTNFWNKQRYVSNSPRITTANIMINKHTDRSFQVGDWVWLKLMARAAVGISKLQKGKLAPKYFGPFQISECIGSVAYHLNLPEEARIHNAFHVSMLKLHKGTPPSAPGQVDNAQRSCRPRTRPHA